jgi:hypothetical protein
MTIRFLAANVKVISWPKRTAMALLGFLVLWSVVALMLRVTHRPA